MQQNGDTVYEFVSIHIRWCCANMDQLIDHASCIHLYRYCVEADQIDAIFVTQIADDAEIHDPNSPILHDDEVPGMGICMEVASLQHFLDHETRGITGKGFQVVSCGFQGW